MFTAIKNRKLKPWQWFVLIYAASVFAVAAVELAEHGLVQLLIAVS